MPAVSPVSSSNAPVSTCLRREDDALLRGQGQFVHHFTAPGMLHAVFVRSEQAAMSIRMSGLDAARSMPGVQAILTTAELGRHTMPTINPLLPVDVDITFPILADQFVSYVGQPVAIVVGTSLAACREAADRVVIEYIAPDAVSEGVSEAVSGSVFDTVSNPVVTRTEIGAPADASLLAGLSSARTVHTRLTSPRVIAMAMEPRACVANWDADSAQMQFHMGTQAPSRARADIAKVLDVSEDQVRVISKDVGGAFGAKASVYPEDLVLALAARHLGARDQRACIKWTSTRGEEFASAMHGRGSEMKGSLSVNEDGRLAYLQASLSFDLGAWLPFSGVVPLRNAARILPGPYTLRHLHVQGTARCSPRAPVNIYRGAGRPEAALLMETLVDAAARRINMDSVALRRINLIRSEDMPWQTTSGETLDSGDYLRLLDMACEAFQYENERQAQVSRRAAGECIGIGVAMYVEPCGQGWESARVTLHEEGRVTVASGSPAQGQGHLTTFAQIAATELGCHPADVSVVIGDTAHCPAGIGSLASRSTAIGGSAIVQACRELRARQTAGEPLPLTAECRFTANEAWSAGCIMVRVRIDTDTGVPAIEKLIWADDAGHLIQPTLVRGQLVGGAAQGLGQALMEQIRYDDDGQLRTGSLMDYAIPRAADMPDIEIHSMHTASPNNLLGAKGVGEAGCIGLPAAIMNAVRDALSHLGEVDLSFPLTAEQIWRTLHFSTKGNIQ